MVHVFYGATIVRLVEVDIEDGDLECLKSSNDSLGKRPVTLRVSGIPMKLCEIPDAEDLGDADSFVRFVYRPCSFQDLSDIHLQRSDYYPDVRLEDDFPNYFLPFAQLEDGDIVGLGLSEVESGVFKRRGYIEIKARPKSGIKDILRFLKKQKKTTIYMV
jgi:hypothetical protein